MKVVVDVAGAPSKSGGMRLYAEELVRAWSDLSNDDQLIVVGPGWIERSFQSLPNVKTQVFPGRTAVGRSVSQFLLVPAMFWLTGAQAILSVSPIVTPLVPRVARFCVVHDWRHVNHRREFSTAQIIYRWLWFASARWACRVFVISSKTLRETRHIAPEARAVLAENGRDHPQRWVRARSEEKTPIRSVVTFGHHANKRPEIVIDAVGRANIPKDQLRLIVLGATGDKISMLRERARCYPDMKDIEFPGFVSEDVYQRTVSSAALIVLASTDEGFGLPVVEANYFGIPVIAFAESGLGEVHGESVITVDTKCDLEIAIARALSQTATLPSSSPRRSWKQLAREIQHEIAQASDRGRVHE